MACSSVIRVATILARKIETLKNAKNTIDLSGVDEKFMNLISKSLNNLDFKIVVAEDGEWGRPLQNGSWTGMIGKIQQNKADIAIKFISITEALDKVVDFSNVYFATDTTFAIEKQGHASTSVALIRPFDSSIWTIMLVVLLLMSLLFRFLLYTKGSFLHVILKLFGAILNQSYMWKFNSFQYRILVITWIFCSMIISFSYSSVLLSILTFPFRIPTVQNFNELSDAVVSQNYKALTYKGSSTLNYLLHHERKALRVIAESSIRNNWTKLNYPTFPTFQINKKSAVVANRLLFQLVEGPEKWKWLYVSDENIMTRYIAIAMRKGFCHKKRLNTLLSRINSAGLYLKNIDDLKFKLWLSHPDRRGDKDATLRPLSLSDLIGAFASYLIGLSISFLVLIIEIAYARFL